MKTFEEIYPRNITFYSFITFQVFNLNSRENFFFKYIPHAYLIFLTAFFIENVKSRHDILYCYVTHESWKRQHHG